MPLPKIPLLFLRLLVGGGCLFIAGFAAESGGTIEGRVSNPDTGDYLELVRLTVEGTSLEAFTDTAGRYRLTNVPPGVAQVKVFRTGLAEQSKSIQIAAGAAVQQDFGLTALGRNVPGDTTVKL